MFRQSGWFLACIGLFFFPLIALMTMVSAISRDLSGLAQALGLIKFAEPHEIVAIVALNGYFTLFALILGKCTAQFGSCLT